LTINLKMGQNMDKAVIVKGTIEDHRHLLLDENIPLKGGRVEIFIRYLNEEPVKNKLFSFIENLSAGNRSKAEIDSQVKQERADWGD